MMKKKEKLAISNEISCDSSLTSDRQQPLLSRETGLENTVLLPPVLPSVLFLLQGLEVR